MGGFVPIGYDANGRTLKINETDAETVRTIYRLYLALGSVDALKTELDNRGICTKVRPGRAGAMAGGLSFSRAHLYSILRNPLYVGEIAHKGHRYPGQHPAIIDRETWDAVQATLRPEQLQAPRQGTCQEPEPFGWSSCGRLRREAGGHACDKAGAALSVLCQSLVTQGASEGPRR